MNLRTYLFTECIHTACNGGNMHVKVCVLRSEDNFSNCFCFFFLPPCFKAESLTFSAVEIHTGTSGRFCCLCSPSYSRSAVREMWVITTTHGFVFIFLVT